MPRCCGMILDKVDPPPLSHPSVMSYFFGAGLALVALTVKAVHQVPSCSFSDFPETDTRSGLTLHVFRHLVVFPSRLVSMPFSMETPSLKVAVMIQVVPSSLKP